VFLQGLWFNNATQMWIAEHGCPSGHDHFEHFILTVTPDGDSGWLIEPLPAYFTPGCTSTALVEARISNAELYRLGLTPLNPKAPSSAATYEGDAS
jgi:hypothetical protein